MRSDRNYGAKAATGNRRADTGILGGCECECRCREKSHGLTVCYEDCSRSLWFQCRQRVPRPRNSSRYRSRFRSRTSQPWLLVLNRITLPLRYNRTDSGGSRRTSMYSHVLNPAAFAGSLAVLKYRLTTRF